LLKCAPLGAVLGLKTTAAEAMGAARAAANASEKMESLFMIIPLSGKIFVYKNLIVGLALNMVDCRHIRTSC
jgi:hypothetical protein